MLAGFAVPLAGLVDTAILGHLPTPTALAGVALGSIVFDFLWGLFGFLRMSTTGLVAQARGAGKPREAQQAGLRSVLLGLAIGLMVLLVYPLLGEAAFDLLGGAPDVQQAGYAYFEQRILAAPATLCGFALVPARPGERPYWGSRSSPTSRTSSSTSSSYGTGKWAPQEQGKRRRSIKP